MKWLRNVSKFEVPTARRPRLIMLRFAFVIMCALVCRSACFADDASNLPPVSVRVFDSITKIPLSGVAVSVRPSGLAELVPVGATTNGALKFKRQNDDKMIEFFCEAQGYRAKSALVAIEENKSVEMFLDPLGFALKGVVIAPTGQSVEGAKILLMNANTHAQLGRGNHQNPWELNSFDTLTDGNGVFSLSAEHGGESLLAVHRLGCANVPVAGWTNGQALRLRPWATLRGRLMINGKPAPNRQLAAVMCDFFGSTSRLGLLDVVSTTDAQGRFAFDQVPSGAIECALQMPFGANWTIFSHWQTFVVDPSLPPTEAIYSLRGRDVTAHGVFEGDFQFRAAEAFTMLRPKAQRPLTEYTPLAGGVANAGMSFFAMTLNGDGDISGIAIPPGEYELAIDFHNFGGKFVRTNFRADIVVPEGDGPVNLGDIRLTNKTAEVAR